MTFNVNSFELAKKEREARQGIDPLSRELVDNVFLAFYIHCHGFDSFYTDIDRLRATKESWSIYFSENRINSRQQIDYGLKKLQIHAKPNPPQLGEFLEWCKPEPKDFGLLDFEQAYQLSIKINEQFSTFNCDKDIYKVIKHAINQIGASTYRNMKQDEARKMFKYYYNLSSQQLMDGNFKEIPKAIDSNIEDDPWKTIKKYGTLPQYAHLNSRDKAMPVINNLMKKIEARFVNRR
jgi:hypothetical protein